MHTRVLILITLIVWMIIGKMPECNAQMRVSLYAGNIQVNGMSYSHDEKKFKPLTDSLDNRIKIHPQDTTALFDRAVLYLYFNDEIAKPYQQSRGALENLKKGLELAQQAIDLKMNDLRLKVLIASLYSQLAYRLTNDQPWEYNAAEIANRRKQFDKYKLLSNQLYDELEKFDKSNAWNYERLKVKSNYPVK